MRSAKNQLNCFSPPVMLATLTVELGLAVYTAWRYTLNTFTKLVLITLACLGTFQLAEYFVCTGAAGHQPDWSRLGFVAITALPPLGIHLMHQLAGRPRGKLVDLAYASMAGFMAYFLLYSTAFTGYKCTGNYVIFQLHDKAGGLYAIYYYLWLAVGLALAYQWANHRLAEGKSAYKRVQTLRAMIIGWLVFLVPTAIVNTVNPASRQAIPSVMCGFAVLFALILALYILPRAAEQRVDKPVKL